MTHHAHTPADRLARYYTEALAKNPKATIYENMAWAVAQMPIVGAAPKLLEALQLILANGSMHDDGTFVVNDGSSIEMAYAAIAKATGADNA